MKEIVKAAAEKRRASQAKRRKSSCNYDNNYYGDQVCKKSDS